MTIQELETVRKPDGGEPDKKIREGHFAFDDLTCLDDRAVQKVLREVDVLDLAKALKKSSPEAQKKVFGNMTRRAALMLREDIDLMGPVRLKDVEEAQRSICAVVRRLEDADEIIIPGPGEEALAIEDAVLTDKEIEAITGHATGEDFECELPETDLSVERGKKPEQLMPDHELNDGEFRVLYYRIMQILLDCSEKARREGLLALEEGLADLHDEFLTQGLRLVVDGTDDADVREVLGTMLEQEHDPCKHLLRRIQCEGILGIQAGCHPRILLLRLNAMVNIPDNNLTPYITGDDAYRKIRELSWDFPAEREEVIFIRRAVSLAEKSRRQGLLSLEKEIDWDAAAREDVFELGLSLVIDKVERRLIEDILDSLCCRETSHWKKKLARVKKAAVLSIRQGDNPRILAMKMLCHFDAYLRDMIVRDS